MVIEIEYGMDTSASVQIKTDGSVEELHRDSVEGVVKVRARDRLDADLVAVSSANREGDTEAVRARAKPGR